MTVKRYTISGTKLALPINKGDVVSVQLVDTDLIIITRDKVQHTLQNAALTAMSEAAFFVEYKDGRATGQQLLQQVGKTQQAKVSAATVRSQDKAVPDIVEEVSPFQVTVQRTEGAGLRAQDPLSTTTQATSPPPSAAAQAPKTTAKVSAAAEQSSSFLGKFLGWTGLGLVVTAVAAQVKKESDSSTDTGTETPSGVVNLPIVNINAVADERASEVIAIQQRDHSDSKQVLLSGSLSQALAADEKIVFYLTQAGAERAVAETKPSGTQWTFVLNDLGEGELELKARVENAAKVKGNWGNAWTWYVDTIDPTASARVTAVEDNEAPTLGNVASGDITNDATPLLRGSISEALAPGETVLVFDTVNGQTTRLGTATVLANNNTWEFQASLPNVTGRHVFTAQVTDQAGNTGPANFEVDQYVLELNLESAGFARPDIGTVTDDRGSIRGNVINFGDTDDTVLELLGSVAGTLNAGERVSVYDGEVLMGTATVSADKTSWSFSATLTEGAHLLRARVESENGPGNGSFGSSFSITVDTQAPAGLATLSTVLDDVGVSVTVSNGGSTDDLRSLIIGKVIDFQFGDTVVLYDSGIFLGKAEVTERNWSFTPTLDYALGLHSITARLEDAAGNAGALSSAYEFQVIAA